MKVCIAEKPSVARDIARILGATEAHDGYYEGNGYQVTWTFGHLCELKYPEDYDERWKRWTLGQLPMIPSRFGIRLKSDKGVEHQFSIIRSLMQQADEIINCGDAGQEGELIQRWVMQKAEARCPVKRLWISSLTEEAITEGFANLKEQDNYQSLYEAGLCRAIGDWLLGMNATRLYTLKYGQRERQAQPLSVGRVQTPTLALIVRRQHEIDHFVPEPYWVLTTTYRDTVFTATKGKFADEAEGRAFLEKVTDKEFEVTDVTRKKGTEAPPRLFDLTSLQVECNKKFSFSAERTLQIIQSLYEKKVTTYPRVDTTYLSEDIYAKCGSILNGLTAYKSLLEPLRGRPLKKSKKVFDSSKVTDHHAIIPTGVTSNMLTADEQKVYDRVVRHFIAVFYDDCTFATTTVQGRVEDIGFKVLGKQILTPGWRSVFKREELQDEDDRSREEEKTLPAFEKGEHGPHRPDLAQKWTNPPKPYTEATLLRAMETAGKMVDSEELREVMKENGIGRPSTRAAIIETLFRRRYIVRERKNIVPTATGCELIGIISEDLLKSAELTGIWEKKLREIEARKYDARQFLDELKQMVREIVIAVLSDNTNRRVAYTAAEEEKKAGRKKKTAAAGRKTGTSRKKKASKAEEPADGVVGKPCPACGKGVIIKGRTAYGCSEWKQGCTFRLPFDQNPEKTEK